ncbi:hypothetical protein KAALPHA_10 [Klebsiella phage vB_KaeM_KaAlpha]|uniref:Uncharacterized protein n=1 Tax=Klebsiella phage vB_KaeM_KaAlpha TaxID=2591367 RepID=A0A5B9NFQ5_9CAUD|nr:hypothetical protein KAALPHA_10 [Klebsiella phage vB_KaeM_KaAlpha]
MKGPSGPLLFTLSTKYDKIALQRGEQYEIRFNCRA